MPMGGVELLVILAIILLFFGARRVPQLARSLGKSKQEFHKGVEEAEAEERDKAVEEAPSPREEARSREAGTPEEDNNRAGRSPH